MLQVRHVDGTASGDTSSTETSSTGADSATSGAPSGGGGASAPISAVAVAGGTAFIVILSRIA